MRFLYEALLSLLERINAPLHFQEFSVISLRILWLHLPRNVNRKFPPWDIYMQENYNMQYDNLDKHL